MFKLFKKQPKKQYTLSEFGFRRVHEDRVQVYHKQSNEWINWHQIVDDVFDEFGEPVSEIELHHVLADRTKKRGVGSAHVMVDNTQHFDSDDPFNQVIESFVTEHLNSSSNSSSDLDSSSSSASSSDSASFD
ncbi:MULTISPECIES: hypothetical protein [Pseudoalteromonas]|uniref:Uncharacterized protein n=1 Tax=Pseudoalteromonas amylolytica TaxID=1859457 RepID=A0A1S1MVE1_9GAMM|nr:MULTISPECIES: hypothetical protein [Pseudoalteromonas]OHU88102.1 hypothetical protein BFC16_11975 [Pseudoalteromonas sp. JW3]OHU91542.1 hypothetical protein BET10_12095 [Pseudoalteromonas amylolytica]